MDITYCNDKCPIGIEARNKFLNENNSAYGAAVSFNFFTEKCFKTCPYKAEHMKETEK
jgi:hypothetical protein